MIEKYCYQGLWICSQLNPIINRSLSMRIRLFLMLPIWLLLSPNQAKSQQIRKFEGFMSKCSVGLKQELAPSPNIPHVLSLDFANLKLRLDAFKRTISGEVLHRATCLKQTDKLYFQLDDSLQVSEVEVNSKLTSFIQRLNILAINLDSTLFYEEKVEVYIKYAGTPSEIDDRAFVQSIRANGSPALHTLSQPYGAMRWWPTIQDLNQKLDSVTIEVTVPTSPVNQVAVSNGVMTSWSPHPDSMTYVYHHRHPIPPYLVAVSVAEYAIVRDTIDMETYQIPELNFIYAERLDEELQYTDVDPIMKLFDSLFIPYPFRDEHYGHAMWERNGGMEHTTMSFMGDFNWDLRAHELAHQWFGDYATCSSWSDIWLNEGFATYLAGLTYQFFEPDTYWPLWKEAQLKRIRREFDGSLYAYDTTSVSRVFNNGLSYAKGAMVLHMLRREIGNDSLYFKGIREYLTTYAYKFATTDDFFAIMEKYAPYPLTGFISSYVYGLGIPNYYISYAEVPEGLELELYQASSVASTSFFPAKIPIRISHDGVISDTSIHHVINGQHVLIPGVQHVTQVAFDPESEIISGENRVFKKSALNAISVYPNPVSNTLFIELNNPSNLLKEVTLINNQGRVIFTKSVNLSQVQLNVENFNSGMYFLLLERNTGRAALPVIIK